MRASQDVNPPHAICTPFPLQGHINPMMKLAKLLHQKGFHITFVNTEFNHRRLLRSRGSFDRDSSDRFRFETIPDGLPPSDEDGTQDVGALCVASTSNFLAPFKRLVSKVNDDASTPPVTCMVSDCIMGFTLEASKELGIPNALFWMASACGLLGTVHYRTLIQNGIVPLKDASYLTNGYLDETCIDWIPGMEGIPLKYLPTCLRTTDANEFVLNFAMREVENARNASALIINTFDKLEGEIIQSLSPNYPPIYTVGPLRLMNDVVQGSDHLDSLESNLWKEQPGCLEWLDQKERNSVVYVNFGSVVVTTSHQLVEFAWGLAMSKKPFLWVVRPDLVRSESTVLPSEFMDEIKERGLLVSWCPQEKVLKHPSVGGFLTHCGWNSTMESLTSGVPMICWPFFADQQTNCWFACTKWGVGVEIESDVKRSEIERQVRELMDGEKGKEMKERAIEWKKLAEESTQCEIGESYLNFNDLVNKVLLNST
ncbi:7-deoxyloganetin glucosyltransferase [Linum grandiflorum]